MFLLLIAAVLIAPALTALVAIWPAPAAQVTEAAAVPSYPNVSCPIMGKPISLRLFTDTDRGRIWVCCKSCIADIHSDVALAYKTAYPNVISVEADRCPVTGKKLVEDSPSVELQGRRFRVFDRAAAKLAVAESQITMARSIDPKLDDVGNATCPIDGKPVAANAFVVVDGRIVRLSSPKHAEEAAKAPAKTLERAREIAGRRR